MTARNSSQVISIVNRLEVALHRGIPGVPQLPPDIDLPEEVGSESDVSQRIGKFAAAWKRELVFRGA